MARRQDRGWQLGPFGIFMPRTVLSGGIGGWLGTFLLISGTRFAGYEAKCEVRDLPWGTDEGTGRG